MNRTFQPILRYALCIFPLWLLLGSISSAQSERTNNHPTAWVRLLQLQQLPNHQSLAKQKRQRVDEQIRPYLTYPYHLNRVLAKSTRYLYFILNELESRNLPSELALLPVIESAFNPEALSHRQAAGLWQFMSATADDNGINQNSWYDGRHDIIEATIAALDHLKSLYGRFDQDWLLSLAAYNAGPGTVHRAQRRNRTQGKPTDYWSLDLPRETEHYIPKLLAIRYLVNNARRYGIKLPQTPNRPTFTIIPTDANMMLSDVAKRINIPLEELRSFNSGFRRGAVGRLGVCGSLMP